MTNDWLFWLIAFAFFLPMHLGAPVLYLFLQGDSSALKAQLPSLLLRSIVIALAGFALAFWLWPNSKTGAGIALAVTFALPWVDILRTRAK